MGEPERANTLVIIPAFNEEESLPPVLAELRAEVPELDVLVVVDGATDATASLARQGGALVADLPFNLGIGGALRTGFTYAARHGYEFAVQFDADGQHDAREIAALLGALEHGADMVVGSRFTDGTTPDYEVGPMRRGAMGALRILLRLLSGRRFTDTSSGFRGFSKPVIQYFAGTYPVEYMDSVEALLLAMYAGFNVVEVPAQMRERAAGVPSTRRFRLVYHYLRLLVVMLSSASWRRRPGQAPA